LLLAASATRGFAADPVYTSPVVHGRVVAAETGAPIARALVIVLWAAAPDMKALLLVNSLRAVETQTDSTGTFRVPAWSVTSLRRPVADSPKVICFVSGREPAPSSYAELAAPPKEPIEIALRAFGGSPQKRVDQLQVILTLLIEAWVPLPGQPTPNCLS
jgi:hypothetical protein